MHGRKTDLADTEIGDRLVLDWIPERRKARAVGSRVEGDHNAPRRPQAERGLNEQATPWIIMAGGVLIVVGATLVSARRRRNHEDWIGDA